MEYLVVVSVNVIFVEDCEIVDHEVVGVACQIKIFGAHHYYCHHFCDYAVGDAAFIFPEQSFTCLHCKFMP